MRLSHLLQVKVQDIHVRFEDSVTVPGKTFAAGITLDTLEVKVCACKALAVASDAVAGGIGVLLCGWCETALYCCLLHLYTAPSDHYFQLG